jgi:1,4-alpha-glucan branching enzyme
MNMKKIILFLFLTMLTGNLLFTNPADSVILTFRTYQPTTPALYLPGEFNSWVNNAPTSLMSYDAALASWTKTYNFKIKDPSDTTRRMGDSVWQYKFYSTAAGWYSDPLNPEQNPADYNNSVVRLTKFFWFQFYTFEVSQNITRITNSLVHANSDSITTIHLTTAQTESSPHTITDVTQFFNRTKRILDYSLPTPIPKSYFIRLVGYNDKGDSVVYKRGGYVIATIPMPAYVKHGVTLPSPASNDSTSFRIRVPGKDYVLLRIAPLGQNPVSASPIVMRRATVNNEWWMNLKLAKGTYEYLYEIENNKMIYDPWGRWNGTNGSRFSTDSLGLTADNYVWQNTNFQRPPMEKLVIYELNVAEFAGGKLGLSAGEATFGHFIETIPYLDSLGVNAIELMPINDYGMVGKSGFSWGYDLNSYFALEPGYGAPADFKALVDSAHGRGIAVIVDVVFNHLNETSPLWQMAQNEDINPYFKRCSDLRYNEDQLCFFKDMDHWTTETQELIYNALKMWIDVYKVDGFRYDLTQGIGWRITEPTKGILGWANRIHTEYSGSIYQIAEHLPESPALIFHSGITSGWHDSFRDEVFKCLIPSQHPTLATIEDRVLDLGAYPSGDTPSTPDRYANRKEPVNATVNHDEQSLIYEMITWQSVPLEQAIQRDKLYVTFMFTSLGIPMLWQGAEFAEPRGWQNDDQKLSYRPVQFNRLPTATGQTHYKYYNRLIFQRLNNPALYNGELRKLFRYNAERVLVWGFEDFTTLSRVMCIANLGGSPQTVKNVPWLAAGDWYDILDQSIFNASSTVIDSIVMSAFSVRIFSNKPDSVLSVADNKISEMPSEFKLFQNYPNPFNPVTIINYQLPTDNYVSLKVFDILGREVATLVNEYKKAGSYNIEWNGKNLPSGVYFYRLVANSNEPLQTKSYTDIKKMILLR